MASTLMHLTLTALLPIIIVVCGVLSPAQANTVPDARRQLSGSRRISYYEDGPGEGSDTRWIQSVASVSMVDVVEQYAKFELSFYVDTVATNPYFPYDPNTPPGIEPGTGVTIDMLLLPPGEQSWANARELPCFYYQPVEEVGTGGRIALLPVGAPEWRARFTPEIVGEWQYKIRVVDASGISESPVQGFAVTPSDRKGFIQVSETDPRFFEFSDGTPFVTPLTSLEQGNPFNTLASIRASMAKLGEGAIRFVRWFPTGEGANYFVAPFGDSIRINWVFGGARTTFDDVDTASGKLFSFAPYYYSAQTIPVLPEARYRLHFTAKVTGEQILRAQLGNLGYMDIASTSSTYHEANGQGDVCAYKQDGWHHYVLDVTNTSAATLTASLRGLYVSSDAPAPYNTVLNGAIRIHSITLQRDETGNGGWGPNLLTRPDPDTYNYVDQRSAARLDEIFRLSEEYGIYHKLPLFHKNDYVFNRIQPDGTVGADTGIYNSHFYSAEGQASRWYQNAYTRYFIARWSYSPSLHSLELANENHLRADSYTAGFDLAEFVHRTSPRHILMSNSFWGWFVASFFTDAQRGHLIDYGDKHWYANTNSTNPEVISRTWDDSAAYVREAWRRFNEYRVAFGYNKPIVRGEGGVALTRTEPQHADIALDPTGTYYHKKLWAHVGVLGDTCDGEWYPRLFVEHREGQFPNSEHSLERMFAAYEMFLQGEPLSSGHYTAIGTDLVRDAQILVQDGKGSLRAWGSRSADTGRVLLWIDNAQHTWRNVVAGAAINPASGNLVVQGLPAGTYAAEWWDTTLGTVIDTESYTVGADGRLTFAVNDLSGDVAVAFERLSAPSPTNTPLPTNSPTQTPLPTSTPTQTPLPTNTPLPTSTPTYTPWPTSTPTHTPWPTNTPEAKGTPTAAPTSAPTDGEYRVPLAAGWNLISLPLAPTSGAIQDVLSSIDGQYDLVYTYDRSKTVSPWRSYRASTTSRLGTIGDPTQAMGIWIHARADVELVVYGASLPVVDIPLRQGWNLVGYPSLTTRSVADALDSISGSWLSIHAHNAGEEMQGSLISAFSGGRGVTDLTELQPGNGYWLEVSQDCVWTVQR